MQLDHFYWVRRKGVVENSEDSTMSNVFGASSTTDEVLQGINWTGKRVLVTGVSAGLGVETARALAAHGAQVIGAARDLSKAQARHYRRKSPDIITMEIHT